MEEENIQQNPQENMNEAQQNITPGPSPNYAGFWIRFLAYFIDYAILFTILFLFLMIISVFSTISYINSGVDINSDDFMYEAQDFHSNVAIISTIIIYPLYFLLFFLYFTIMESSKKQATLGKMALGLKVVDYKGQRISFGRSLGRYFSKFLSSMILMIGYIMIGFTEKKQGLHDMIASTYVIKK